MKKYFKLNIIGILIHGDHTTHCNDLDVIECVTNIVTYKHYYNNRLFWQEYLVKKGLIWTSVKKTILSIYTS
jgi:hypothetical protein